MSACVLFNPAIALLLASRALNIIRMDALRIELDQRFVHCPPAAAVRL